jgi:predicted secreted Zn-dependent protease
VNGAETKPTLETVLERLDSFRTEVLTRFDSLENRFDRVESMTNQTRAEMLTLRADFREWRSTLKEHLPALR